MLNTLYLDTKLTIKIKHGQLLIEKVGYQAKKSIKI